MKNFLLILALAAVLGLCLVVTAIWGRGCDTANEMADQTIFNASQNVWSYEKFHEQYAAYEQYRGQLEDAEARLEALKSEGVREGQEYDNLVTEISGIRQMQRRIAADYNAASQIAYQGIWKSRGLPDKLE
jgi:hypothetical protein